MRILNVNVNHPAKDKRVYHKIAKTLKKYDNEVFCTAKDSSDRLTEDGIYIKGFRRPQGRFGRFLSYPKIMRICYEVGPEAIIAHEPDALVIGYLYHRKHPESRLIFDSHEYWNRYFWTRMNSKAIARFLDLILFVIIKYILRRSNAVLTVTFSMNDVYKKVIANTFFMPNMADSSMVNGEPLSDRKGIVYYGEFLYDIQRRVLINTAKALKGKGICCKISILGGDNQYIYRHKQPPLALEAEREGVSEYFDLLGWHPMEMAMQILGKYGMGLMRFDNLENPGLHCMSNKFFECMSLGLGIISSKQSLDAAQVIEEEQCGILCDEETAESLASVIAHLIEHPAEAKRYGDNAYEAYIKKYNWANFGSQLNWIVTKA